MLHQKGKKYCLLSINPHIKKYLQRTITVSMSTHVYTTGIAIHHCLLIYTRVKILKTNQSTVIPNSKLKASYFLTSLCYWLFFHRFLGNQTQISRVEKGWNKRIIEIEEREGGVKKVIRVLRFGNLGGRRGIIGCG